MGNVIIIPNADFSAYGEQTKFKIDIKCFDGGGTFKLRENSKWSDLNITDEGTVQSITYNDNDLHTITFGETATNINLVPIESSENVLSEVKPYRPFAHDSLTSMRGFALNCTKITKVDMSMFNGEGIIDWSYAFRNIGGWGGLQTYITGIENLVKKHSEIYAEGMFGGKIYSDIDISNWKCILKSCSTLFQLYKGKNINCANIDFSKSTNYERMFEVCSNLISLNLDNTKWNTKNNTNKMFYKASKLKVIYVDNISIDEKNFIFNVLNTTFPSNPFTADNSDMSLATKFERTVE